MLVSFVVAVFANVGLGAVRIPPAHSLAILLRDAGVDVGIQVEPRLDAVLWNIRLPRVLLAILMGASLGVAGAVLQGVFRNPLAEPGVIGVSSGAATGAVAAIVLGFDTGSVTAASPWPRSWAVCWRPPWSTWFHAAMGAPRWSPWCWPGSRSMPPPAR